MMGVGAFAQKQVYNVQQYCIDELPFHSDSCDIKGNEYSFVFVDTAKKEVAVYLSDTKILYNIESVVSDERGLTYTLKDKTGNVEMTVNKAQNRVVITGSTRKISLIVGKSTKMV